MTAREADEGISAANDAPCLTAWLEQFAAKEDRTHREVRRAFFDQILASHSRAMENGIGSFPEEGVKRAVPVVLETVKVIKMLLLDLKGVSGVRARGTGEDA